MKFRLSTIIALLLGGLTLSANGQSILGSQYPLGMPVRPNSSMSLSMGGTGIGTPSDNNVLLLNPANLGSCTKTVFSGLVSLDFLNILNTADNTHTNHIDFLPQQFAFGIPLGIAGTIGFSYNKRFDDRVRFLSRQNVGLLSIDSIELAYGRDGGITTWQAGWGYAIGKWGSVGIDYERAYFDLHQAQISSTFGYTVKTTVDTTDIAVGINGFRAGVLFPIEKLSIGLTGEYFFPEQVNAVHGVYNGFYLPDSQMATTTFTLTLPPSLGAGLSYKFAPEWLANCDISAQLWHYFHADGSPMLFAAVQNAFSYSAGAQYVPAPNLLTPKYWEIIQYRLGARFTQLPAKNNAEWAASFGTGLPFSKGAGLLDVVLEYGRRFDTSFKDNQEEFFSINFGFNGGRKWAASTQNGY